MDRFFEKLAEGQQRASSSEHLSLLAKKAAGKFIRKEASSLGDAVTSVVQEAGDLNKEQIQRVSEMSNQAAWRELFHEGGNRDTSFAPANGDQVLASLAEKSVEITEPNLDYLLDPPGETIPDNFDLAEAFGVKDGSPEYAALNPHAAAENTLETVKAASETLHYSSDKLAAALREEGERFYQLVKQAHLTYDHGVAQIARAVGTTLESASFAQEIMTGVAERLQNEGVDLDTQKEMRKLAEHVVCDADHPLLQSALNFEKTAQAYHKTLEAKRRLDEQHDYVDQYLRDKLREV